MNSILTWFRDVCGHYPGLVISVVVVSLALGIFVGYRLLGPALFG